MANKWFNNIDLKHPLTDHPLWRNVRGVWLVTPQLSGSDILYDVGLYKWYGHNYGTPYWSGFDYGLCVDMKTSCRLFDTQQKPTPGDITILAWVKFHVRNSYGNNILSLDEGQSSKTRHWQFGMDQSTPYPLKFVVSTDGSNVTKVNGSTSLSLYKWYYCTVTFNNSSGETIFYLDGKHDATATADHPIYSSSITSSLRIGRAYYASDTSSTSTDLYGYLSNLIMFDRVLSAEEITIFYQQSIIGYPDLIRRASTKKTFYLHRSWDIFNTPIIQSQREDNGRTTK